MSSKIAIDWQFNNLLRVEECKLLVSSLIGIVNIKLHMSRLENSNCLDGDEGDIAECDCPEQRDERLQRTLAALPPPLPAGRRHRSAPPRRRCSTLHQVC